jgi:anti-anti-sigma factor
LRQEDPVVTPFAVTKRDDGAGVHRLMIAGELDEDTSEGCAALIANAAEHHEVSVVVVDLRRVTFLAAAGVRALVRGREATLAAGREFRVVNATGIVYQVLRISGVHQLLAVTIESGVPATDPPRRACVCRAPSRECAADGS